MQKHYTYEYKSYFNQFTVTNSSDLFANLAYVGLRLDFAIPATKSCFEMKYLVVVCDDHFSIAFIKIW